MKNKVVWLFLCIMAMVCVSCQSKSTTKNQDIPVKKDVTMNSKYEIAVYGGGCFWCLEALYQRLDGVNSVTSGYAGGTEKNPTYQRVSAGFTGHAEVIQIEFDPKVITYEKLLEIFWDMHDPTQLNRQGADYGTQYRSIILTTTPSQKISSEELREKLNLSGIYKSPIVTEIKELETFFPAEDYHQNYFNENKFQPYCNVVIAPKVKHFTEKYKDLLKK